MTPSSTFSYNGQDYTLVQFATTFSSTQIGQEDCTTLYGDLFPKQTGNIIVYTENLAYPETNTATETKQEVYEVTDLVLYSHSEQGSAKNKFITFSEYTPE